MPDDTAALAAPAQPLAALVERLLETPPDVTLTGPAREFERARAAPVPGDIALVCAAEALQLDDAQLLAAAATLACASDARLARRVALLQGDGAAPGPAAPTAGLVAQLALQLGWLRDVRSGVLELLGGIAVQAGLLDLVQPQRGADACFAIAQPVLSALVMRTPPATNIAGTQLTPLTPPQWPLPAELADTIALHARWLARTPAAVLVVRASNVDEAQRFASLVAAATGAPAALLAAPAEGIGRGAAAWFAATGAVPVVAARGNATVDLPDLAPLHWPVVVALGPDGGLHCHRPQREWTIGLPTLAQRRQLWRGHLGAADAAQVERLARHARPGLGALLDAMATTSEASSEPAPEAAQSCLEAECQRQLRLLAPLALPLPASAAARAFVAPPALGRALTLLAERCRAREDLPALLGPAFGEHDGLGVKALFVGASGTGKTLAAHWLAAGLQRPLLRVDLAAVTSKYIGETEKHLAQLLARAESLDVVLLFDEADALFGARTEIKQSNDRHANAQTNYLLTRLESFAGVALLTANSQARFDSAFMRRLDAVIEFPLPAAQERRRLWDLHLGAQPAVGDSRRNALAGDLDLTGGQIRNAALAALLLARTAGRTQIAWDDVVQACALELAKHGRQLPHSMACTLDASCTVARATGEC